MAAYLGCADAERARGRLLHFGHREVVTVVVGVAFQELLVFLEDPDGWGLLVGTIVASRYL